MLHCLPENSLRLIKEEHNPAESYNFENVYILMKCQRKPDFSCCFKTIITVAIKCKLNPVMKHFYTDRSVILKGDNAPLHRV